MGPVVDAAAVGSLLARDANERAMTPEELGQLLVDLVAQGQRGHRDDAAARRVDRSPETMSWRGAA
jgi:hypothetical protein